MGALAVPDGGVVSLPKITPPIVKDSSVKTALILSAGGMFGSYQAGVWSVLSNYIQPDLVVGASIGSLNGWLIAGRCPAEALIERWQTLEGGAQVRWRMPQSFSDGIIASDVVESWIQDVFAACTPVLEYGVVATELRRMRPRLFRNPGLTWQHLAASCSAPVFLPPHRIDGVLYGDGGLIDPLPLWAARELGATRVVAVNLLPRRPLLLRAVAQGAQAYGKFRNPSFEGMEVVTISPAEDLGTARDSVYWSKANTERWIDLGKKDAYTLKHLVVECFERK